MEVFNTFSGISEEHKQSGKVVMNETSGELIGTLFCRLSRNIKNGSVKVKLK